MTLGTIHFGIIQEEKNTGRGYKSVRCKKKPEVVFYKDVATVNTNLLMLINKY